MQGLTVLNLGSGSGGTVTEAFEDKFIDGISCLSKLEQFTLRYDCTNRILQVGRDIKEWLHNRSENVFTVRNKKTNKYFVG